MSVPANCDSGKFAFECKSPVSKKANLGPDPILPERIDMVLAQDHHVIDWLRHVDPDVMPMPMLQRATREELFCLLWIATGATALDKLPTQLSRMFMTDSRKYGLV